MKCCYFHFLSVFLCVISWAEKFASHKKIDISTLQRFSVVLRDESDKFVEEFIENIGLSHLCRLAALSVSGASRRGKSFSNSSAFDIELLRVMKAIIDINEWALKSLVCFFVGSRV